MLAYFSHRLKQGEKGEKPVYKGGKGGKPFHPGGNPLILYDKFILYLFETVPWRRRVSQFL